MEPVFQYAPAPKEVDSFIKYFWKLDGMASETSPYNHSIIPDATIQLLYISKGNFSKNGKLLHARKLIQTATSLSTGTYSTNTDYEVYGVCVYPHSIPVLFNSGNLNLLQHMQGIFELEHSWQALVNRLSSYLTQSVLRIEVPYFVPMILELYHSNKTVNHLSDEYGVSPRQVQRLVKKYTGVTPGTIIRLNRIQKTLDSENESLATKALEAGFYDQSHFNNDFKTITGITPNHYFVQKHTPISWRMYGREVAFFQEVE